ncbi:hypothetical protein LCGC14_2749630 [marine sediment metagenome]|uniref:Uncharacterized protein n=1 Tax=marine sediment metagenome TaxID=412755 RepID=A0A0F8ZP79_9ZZZZ
MEMMTEAEPVEQELAQQPISQGYDPYAQAQQQQMLLQKEYLDVLKHYSQDESIPEEVTKSRWAIFGKGLSLTFLDEKDLPIIDMFNNILRINSLINQPAHRISFEETNQLDQTQLYFYLQAKRAIGTNQGKVNERTLQVTQIGQSISTQTMNGPQQPRRGILAKVRGML